MSIMRNIEHPGVEIREIDLSQITPTPVGTYFYIAGYTDKGEEYEPYIITSNSTYKAVFGEPTNEAEKYHYYACKDVILNKGTVVAAKLPYDNELSGNYKTLQIAIGHADDINTIPELTGYNITDEPYNITSGAPITLYQNEMITREEFDTLKVGEWPEDDGNGHDTNINSYAEFVIVNEKKKIYGGPDQNEGVFVVITDALDAMNVQRMLSGASDDDPMDVLTTLSGLNEIPDSEYADPLTGTYRDDSISEWIMRKFPTITYLEDGEKINNEYTEYIGVIVCNTHYNYNDGEKISVGIVESYAGSIYPHKRNKATGQTEYICDIVNGNSQIIKMYGKSDVLGNVDGLPTESEEILVYNLSNDYQILGFKKDGNEKKIDGGTMQKQLEIAMEKVSNINEIQIDVVEDAGLSTIAQFTSLESKIFDPVNDKLNLSDITDASSLRTWKCIASTIDTFCSKIRRDCMAIIDSPRHMVLQGNQKYIRKTQPDNVFSNTIGQKLKYITGLNSSYSAIYINWFAITDEFTGKPLWIPESVKAGGVYAYTDTVANMWDAPAGLNRGQVRGVYDLSFNPDAKDMDAIYTKSLNYAVKYPLDGFIIEGQKTSQAKPSAFDRVNVRRLFLRLERAVYGVSRYFVYEPNNLFTRRRLLDVITPMFQAVKSAGGLYDYKLICDETNNTPDVIDNNEMKVAILLKPVRTAEYILVDFVATRTDANFEEIAQQI